LKKSDPVIIACTNCPWDLDPAFVRRFERRIFVDLPSSDESLEILQKRLDDKISLSISEWKSIRKELDGNNYSGSDITNITNLACHFPIDELLRAHTFQMNTDGSMTPVVDDYLETSSSSVECSWRDVPSNLARCRSVQYDDIINAIRKTNTTVTTELRKKYSLFSTIF